MSNNYGLVIFHVSCPWKCCGCWHWSVGIFHVLFVQKKSDLLLALKMLWWWFARNRQQARGTLPPCLHCQTATGNNPHAWVLPLGTGGNGGSKKIPGGGFLSLGMLPSAAKVGLTGHIFRKQTEMKSKGNPSPNVNAQRPTQPSAQSLPFTLYNFMEKVYFTSSNYHQSLVFLLQL